MPYKDPDPTDPNILVGVMLPGDEESTREMAYVFAEEFARMGYNTAQILTLFKTPFYSGAHGAYKALGEKNLGTIIDECVSAWSGAQFSILDFGFSIGEQGGEIQNRKSKIQNGKRES